MAAVQQTGPLTEIYEEIDRKYDALEARLRSLRLSEIQIRLMMLIAQRGTRLAAVSTLRISLTQLRAACRCSRSYLIDERDYLNASGLLTWQAEPGKTAVYGVDWAAVFAESTIPIRDAEPDYEINYAQIIAGAKAKIEASAEKLQKKLYRWKLSVLQSRISKRFADVGPGRLDEQPIPFAEIVLQHLLWFCCQSDSDAAYRRRNELAAAIEDAGGRTKRDNANFVNTLDVFGSLMTLQPGSEGRSDLFVMVCHTLSTWWQAPCEGYHRDVTPEAIEHAAEQLGLSITDPWELTREFLELHSIAGLTDLAKEWKYQFGPKVSGKASMIAHLLKHCSDAPAPKCVTKMKAVKL